MGGGSRRSCSCRSRRRWSRGHVVARRRRFTGFVRRRRWRGLCGERRPRHHGCSKRGPARCTRCSGGARAGTLLVARSPRRLGPGSVVAAAGRLRFPGARGRDRRQPRGVVGGCAPRSERIVGGVLRAGSGQGCWRLKADQRRRAGRGTQRHGNGRRPPRGDLLARCGSSLRGVVALQKRHAPGGRKRAREGEHGCRGTGCGGACVEEQVGRAARRLRQAGGR
mmetsp:Transcript_120520/g.348297  ORF Transcript_120520/g.348297 Transcript_120520/m.348297 type:complete len:223 (-) Transcript_120520:408-1076(-)